MTTSPAASGSDGPDGRRSGVSPKDTYITVYGRKPVREVLEDRSLTVDKVLVADNADAGAVRGLLDAAAARGIPVRRPTAQRVKVLAGNGRHDQGVLADVVAPGMRPVETFLAGLGPEAPARVLVLDGLTNPTNVGLILRSGTAAGLDGVLLPRRGVPAIDPLVIKASAGVAFRAPVLRAGTAAAGLAALADAGFLLLGLDAADFAATSLYDVDLPARVALVVGAETDGLGPEVRAELHASVAIPMAAGVESLNAACAATVAAFELRRRIGSDGATDPAEPAPAGGTAS